VPDVLALVEADPCAAIEIVSAAHFSRDAENICLQQAIEALGTVESLTLLREYATSSGDTWLGLNSHKLRRFWASTLFGAASARELAQWANHPNPESVFLVSLLHNTGEPLALSLLEGELHRQWSILSPNMASLVAYQHERLGRVYLGSRNIPSTICDIAGDHHNPIQSMLQALVFLGDTAALQYGYGYLRRTVDKHLLNAALKILNEPKLKLNELAAAIAPFLNKSLTVAR
jgi:HD-like signal output (HDOD) protein